LEDKGEPGDTFDGIKAYLETYHPKIVIFENTMNALWMAEKVANWRGKKDEKNIRGHMEQAGFYRLRLKGDAKTKPSLECLAKTVCQMNRLD
jgi:hypothetical protein